MIDRSHPSRPCSLATFVLLILCALLSSPALGTEKVPEDPVASKEPWGILERVRAATEAAGVLEANFVQTYIPAGFSSGEQESGRFFMELPDCLRWDYSEPYPKSFLLCGGVVHAWNPEDRSGRRFLVEPEDEPGLDLLLVSTVELRKRYRATVETQADGGLEIQLEPYQESERLKEAQFTVRPGDRHIARIRYQDAEGGTTTFDLKQYRRAAPGRDIFTAPTNIDWQED